MSLSPRPEMEITMISSLAIVPARRRASATAWADSRAGMIPSARERYAGASIASSSHGRVLGAPGLVEVGVLGADAGIIEPGSDRMAPETCPAASWSR